jgi:hypothetical protein
MNLGKSFKDAYLEVYQNLNEVAATTPANTPTKPKEEEKKASTPPPAAKPTPTISKDVADIKAMQTRSQERQADMAKPGVAGYSAAATQMMSPRTKAILGGQSVYSKGAGRDDMIARNNSRISDARKPKAPAPVEEPKKAEAPQSSTSTSTSSTTPSTKLDTSKFQKVGSAAPSSTTSPTPSSTPSSSGTSPTVVSRTGDLNIAIGNRGNTKSKTVYKYPVGTKTKIKTPSPIVKKPEKSEKPEDRNEPKNPRNRNKNKKGYSGYPLGMVYNPDGTLRSLSSSYEYDAKLVEDIVNYLLDEGYAETPEAAEKIMENMSEKWISNIIG